LLGLEAANGLLRRGLDVTVVHLHDTLMERQLDTVAGTLLKESLEQRGIRFHLSARTAAILGSDRVTGVRFADGSEMLADLVIMAAGIRPNIELAKAAKLPCERGVLVDDTLQTFDPRIYAVGECVQHRGATYGLVAPLWRQAQVCANHLAELGVSRYRSCVTASQLKVSGIDLFSAGDLGNHADCEALVFQDPGRGVYRKLVIRDNRLQGTVLFGDTHDGPWYYQLMCDGIDITPLREQLVFGRAYLEAA
jgi:nitrite reductase (NADH) large subunit